MGRDVMQTIENVKAMQLTIDKMLERGTMALRDPFTKDTSLSNKWVLEPLYQAPECAIGFVHISHVGLGPCETHIHKDAREYLIVVRGSIILNIDGHDVRVVREGECCAIEEGCAHYSKPLTDNTKLVYVCVPNDIHIPSPKVGM